MKRYREQNPEKAKASVDRCFADPEKAAKYKAKRAEWYKTYAPIARERAKKWALANPERTKEANKSRGKKWRDENKPRLAKKQSMRRSAKMQRTPEWLSETDLWVIDEIYELAARRTLATGTEWHVDHIIPLCGETVSGLHVPWNLRVITASENIRKSNQLIDI